MVFNAFGFSYKNTHLSLQMTSLTQTTLRSYLENFVCLFSLTLHNKNFKRVDKVKLFFATPPRHGEQNSNKNIFKHFFRLPQINIYGNI